MIHRGFRRPAGARETAAWPALEQAAFPGIVPATRPQN